MVLISILLSVALVAVIYNQHRNGGEPTWYAFCALAILTAIASVVGVLPALWLHCLLVFVGALVWKWKKWSSRALRIYMIYAAAPGYVIAAGVAVSQIQEHEQASNGEFVSIEERLPTPKTNVKSSLAPTSVEFLDRLEAKVRLEESHQNTANLEKVHESAVAIFVNSPGFGVTRMIRPSSWPNDDEETAQPSIDQPGTPFMSTMGEKDLQTRPANNLVDIGRDLHLASVFDFVNVKGFGTVESRQKVQGFRPHQFSKLPECQMLRVQTVELVSLLLHDVPKVYVSEKLPSMKDVRKVPTRTLNMFEEAGLAELRKGDNIFICETNEGTRMLGALRSVEACIKCHGGQRGDLLGAFSYSLTYDR